ncbi:acylphosphatase [Lysobacter korlensis]|uniref:acylphosphatase n=1 Tax=Lysobacter korlensis TaxID=553636 RepID=A0ABV6RXK6_9GAMM
MSNVERIRVRAVARGAVQGVGFRYSARREAQKLGLGGFARNLPDGGVELEAEGSPEAVEEFIAWSRRGPIGARVDDLDAEDVPAVGEQDFTIRR